MRFLPLILLIFCLNQKCKATDLNNLFKLPNSIDTIRKKINTNDSLINAVLENKITPPKETAEHINNLTKYGFKNLFTQYNYNPALPYSSQINPNAELFMSDYLRIHKTQLLKMKSYAVPYFDLIDNIFTQYGLPKELKYLAVIESSLKTNATSWVGAAGPWQFMPQTGRNYGLKITRYNDERRDYFKSTHAAAKFLLKLYADLQDWLLVIAAYNGGPLRVYSAIKKSGSNDFWKLQYYLPLESRNHVKKFITTHYIMESKNMDFKLNDNTTPNKSNITEAEAAQADTLFISGKYKSKVIIKNIHIESDIFQKYNPEFDLVLLKTGEYKMILPSDKMNLFKQNKYAILNECVQLTINDD
jgi:membrane-bound lytic murein transglycosylase D